MAAPARTSLMIGRRRSSSRTAPAVVMHTAHRLSCSGSRMRQMQSWMADEPAPGPVCGCGATGHVRSSPAHTHTHTRTHVHFAHSGVSSASLLLLAQEDP
eukprot:1191910-Prorocentrum_minimum.AAC.1